MPIIDTEQISNWLLSVIELEKCISGDINFIFCSDPYLLSINQQYLKHDYFTDIITFDYSESNIVSGDVYISLERVSENAIEFSKSFSNELSRILVHGVLHLIGYEDSDENKRKDMSKLEDKYLNRLIIK